MAYRRTGVSKLDYATYLAAALAYLVGQQRDAAGLLAVDASVRASLPPSTRPGQIREMLSALEQLRAGGALHVESVFDRTSEMCDKRSLVVVFSDLLDCEAEVTSAKAGGPFVERLRQLRARGHDVVLFHLLDPDEIELPFDELTYFEATEPGDTRTLLAEARDLARAFREESAAFRARWRSACLEARVEYRFGRTDTPPAELLHAFLAEREGQA
jgi:uncharacterized protein (DUF58 family)